MPKKTIAPEPTSKTPPHKEKGLHIAFGQALRAIRLEQGITQEQLAWETKMERAFISELERGVKGASLLTVFRLAEGLKVSPGTLVDQAKEKLDALTPVER